VIERYGKAKSEHNGSKSPRLRSVELFSGCGGLALGLARAGFHHELLVERDDDAIATVLLNQKRGIEHVRDWHIAQSDVRSVDWSKFKNRIELVAGGPPCQPFSVGGKHRGHRDDRDMWPEAIRAVREIWPRAFLFENVRGLARPAFADYLQWIMAALANPRIERAKGETHASHFARISRSGARSAYEVRFLQVNAANYGAPQKRQRIVFIGIRRDLGPPIDAPPPTHNRERMLWDQWITAEYWARHGRMRRRRAGNPVDQRLMARLKGSPLPPIGLPWVTVRDAIADLGPPNGLANHVPQPGARTYAGHTGSPLDEPAKALKAGDHGVPGGENMMICENGRVRYFTVREAARLQGLPDDFVFECAWSEAMRQIGNAVPVQLAETFGKWIARALQGDMARSGKTAA
jgi:DNA (cytosine-5)-methyltransferase 1